MAGPLTLSFSWNTPPGNYPGSPTPTAPWQGQPRQLAPASSYYTPKVKPPAEEFNFLLGNITADLTAINTYLQNMIRLGVMSPFGYTTTTSGIVVPENCFWMGAMLWGGGGGGEGGCRGENSPATGLFAQGGGGAGAPFCFTLFPTVPGNHLKATVGTGGPGGAAGGGQGSSGGFSRVEDTDASVIYITAPGGAGCGCNAENWSGGLGIGSSGIVGTIPFPTVTTAGQANSNLLWAIAANTVIAPGAVGLNSGAPNRGFPFGLTVGEFANNTSVPTKVGSVYDLARWIPAVPGRGGSVMVIGKGGAGGTWDQVSLDGIAAASQWGNAGGPGGTAGTAGGPSAGQNGGCGGGGGGGGPGGAGGNGGNGGNVNALPPTGSPGGDAASNSGGGGGGGGCGGANLGSGSAGGAGGNGGDGYVFLFSVSGPPPP